MEHIYTHIDYGIEIKEKIYYLLVQIIWDKLFSCKKMDSKILSPPSSDHCDVIYIRE